MILRDARSNHRRSPDDGAEIVPRRRGRRSGQIQGRDRRAARDLTIPWNAAIARFKSERYD
jgi:hypothetical protein